MAVYFVQMIWILRAPKLPKTTLKVKAWVLLARGHKPGDKVRRKNALGGRQFPGTFPNADQNELLHPGALNTEHGSLEHPFGHASPFLEQRQQDTKSFFAVGNDCFPKAGTRHMVQQWLGCSSRFYLAPAGVTRVSAICSWIEEMLPLEGFHFLPLARLPV